MNLQILFASVLGVLEADNSHCLAIDYPNMLEELIGGSVLVEYYKSNHHNSKKNH
jgi:hypothetical protein